MMRSLFSGVSGLKIHQTRMDSIGNNIANINTTGFKSSRTTFSDMLSEMQAGAGTPTAQLGGTNPRQVGLGSAVASIDIIFNDGAAQSTGKNTDIALTGNALFIVKNGDQSYYTRDGAFEFDAEGNYVLPGTGLFVQGWNAVDGSLNTNAEPENIVVPAGKIMNATATTRITFSGNLDAGDPLISTISYTNSDGETITLDPNASYEALAGEIENVTNIQKDNWSTFIDLIEPGIVNSNTAGVVTISDDVWEDYNLDNLGDLTQEQVLAKITEFIAALNNTYLRKRKNADGNQVTLSNTAMISSKKLMTDYSAASAGNSDVKVAMANNINDLNEIFANQRIITFGLDSGGNIIPSDSALISTLASSTETSDQELLANYFQLAYERGDSNGIISTSYGDITTSTSLKSAKSIMSTLISDLNKTIRNISLLPPGAVRSVDESTGLVTDVDITQLNSSKIYLNIDPTSTKAATALSDIKGVQFSTDGSDLLEKFSEFNQLFNSANYTLQRFVGGGTGSWENEWSGITTAYFFDNYTNLKDAIDAYNFIKVKAFLMTNATTGASTDTDTNYISVAENIGLDSDTVNAVYDPFFATLDYSLDTDATVADVSTAYRRAHEAYTEDKDGNLDYIGYCNIIAAKYTELANAIDASDSSTKANYDKYYEDARALYNHLQAKAYNSTFSTDGSDLLVIGSDEYNDLLELIPGGTSSDPRASFLLGGENNLNKGYNATAVLTDYYHALRVQQATEFNSIIVGKNLTVTDENGDDISIDEDVLETYYDNDEYKFVTATSAYLTLSDGTRQTVTTGTYHVEDSIPITTVITVFDSEGGEHKVPILLEKTDANTWVASLRSAYKDFTDQDDRDTLKVSTITEDDGSVTTIKMRPIYIYFNGDGTFSSGSSDIELTYSGANGAETTQATVDFSSLTQFDGNSTAYPSADGNKAGVLTSVAIDTNGIITGTYTNGLRQQEAQVAVAQFTNAGGLTKIGNTYWQESNNSGAPNVKTAPDLGIGITPSALEMSNVDLANEFSDMIITQRGFQANSKIINVGDEMLETLVNMKR